ncbi:MAG: hypothetical protein H0U70_02125 [Tatlockia sp.]|nr:hypothetical protein [Tatlockia sp.]
MKKCIIILDTFFMIFLSQFALADPTQNPVAPQPSKFVNPGNSSATTINHHFNNHQSYDMNTNLRKNPPLMSTEINGADPSTRPPGLRRVLSLPGKD